MGSSATWNRIQVAIAICPASAAVPGLILYLWKSIARISQHAQQIFWAISRPARGHKTTKSKRVLAAVTPITFSARFQVTSTIAGSISINFGIIFIGKSVELWKPYHFDGFIHKYVYLYEGLARFINDKYIIFTCQAFIRNRREGMHSFCLYKKW